MSISEEIEKTIRDIPDFPKPGILFKDITPLLENHELSERIIHSLAEPFLNMGINAIIGVESRGFLYGMLLAQKLKVPFIPVRKAGKLPYKTISYSYDLEYGSAVVEMHIDTIQPNWKVLIHDDLLATGGTAAAAAELVKMQHAEVCGFCFLVELEFLGGAERLKSYSPEILSLVHYA